MGSAGRRDKRYLAAKAEYRTGNYPCRYGCGRPGTTPDHVPPLNTVTDWRTWQGHYEPACLPCQCRQGGRMAQAQRTRTRRWSY
jgi:hypothetical protein